MLRNFSVQFIHIFTQLLIFAIFARVILSWLPMGGRGRLIRFLVDATEPILGLFRRLIPPIGMIDLSPLFAFLALDFLRAVIIGFLS